MTHCLDHSVSVLGGKVFVTALQPLSEHFPAGVVRAEATHSLHGSVRVTGETEVAYECLPHSLILLDDLDRVCPTGVFKVLEVA